MTEQGTENRPASSDRPLVSVVIVSFNSGPILIECILALLRSTSAIEVLVYDNASDDGAIEAVEHLAAQDARLRTIRGRENSGFAAGCNRALALAGGRFVLFLNPDCIVRPDTIGRMASVLDAHPASGMAGCLIRNTDGSIQAACRRTIPTPRKIVAEIGRLLAGRKNPARSHFSDIERIPGEPHAVEAISGAFMLVRRDALDAVGSFDEGYFLHWEDVDLCQRFSRAGYGILFVPDVEVLHYKGHCSSGQRARVEWHKNFGLLRFLRKNFFSPFAGLLLGAVAGPLLLARWAYVLLTAKPGAASPPRPEATPFLPPGTASRRVWVLGATSPVGAHLLPRLAAAGYQVHAFSRAPWAKGARNSMLVTWHETDLIEPMPDGIPAEAAISLVPLTLLPAQIDALARAGIRRLVAFSSTSVLTKRDSACAAERESARRLAAAEEEIGARCARHGIAWMIFRPTITYSWGIDRNLMRLADFIRRFGFLVLPGEGKGLRQPVHAADLAQACLSALSLEDGWNDIYNLGGGETLSYREMVARVAGKLGRRPRIFSLPLPLWRPAIAVMRLFPGWELLNPEMARRVDSDMVFDQRKAAEKLGYSPRPFRP